MKIKKTIFYIALIVLVISACTKRIDGVKQLTYNEFKDSLTSSMDYAAVVNEFGPPRKDIGSGIHIYVYELDDSTEVWIGYSDRILYARHVDKHQTVLHTIIGNDIRTLTYDYFIQHLKSQMDYTAIVDVFGQPLKDIGSGIHIYVYELADATEVWIGYTDKIFYAKHVDKNHHLLDTII